MSKKELNEEAELEKNKNIIKNAFFLFSGIAFGLILSLFLNYNKVSISKKSVDKELYNPISETYQLLSKKYYKDVDKNTLIDGALTGMMAALGDKHSVYFDKESKESFETELSGEYYGIGAEIKQIEDEVIIYKVFDDSPAKKAGLKNGDVLLKIDKEDLDGKNPTEVASILRSKKKETSTIVVRRDNEELAIKVTKDNVTLLSVSSEMLDDNIGYVIVSIFGDQTYEQFKTALDELEEKGMESLIIDLRGNSGGYLTTVTRMMSDFVPEDTVIYQMKKKGKIEKYTSLNDNVKNYKVVILIDQESASASEIMASTMQNEYGAVLVGKTTYGKGTVQETADLSNGTLIKYTIEEWLTSKGKSINDKGVDPDYEVDLSENFKNNPSIDNDDQLQKAIEVAKE